MKTLRILTSSLVSIAGLFGFSYAKADGGHPGTFCVPETSNDPNVTYSQWGLQNNSTTGSVTIHCPGPDYQHNWLTNGTISVWVYDRTPTANDLCCTSRVLNADGSTLSASAQVCAPNFGSQAQQLLFGTHGGYGAFDVQCSIPKKDATNGLSHLTTYVSGSGPDGFGHVTVVPGQVCTPQANAAANVKYEQYGIKNLSTTASVGVQCGGPQYNGVNVANVTMTIYDRTTTPNDHCCTARVLASDGNPVSSDGPKCAPNFGSSAQTISYNVTGAGTLDFFCSIPKYDSVNGGSYISSIQYDNYD